MKDALPTLRGMVSYRNARFAAAVLLLAFAVGCTAPSGGGGGNSNGSTDPNDNTGASDAEIGNLTSTVQLSGNQSFTVFYSVPQGATNIYAFYVQVSDALPGSEEIGERIELAASLQAGNNLNFTFSTSDLAIGLYRVGVTFVDAAGGTRTVLSTGVVDLQGSPNPVFIEPFANVTIEQDTPELVDVLFDCMDPENVNVRWRLFYAAKTTIDTFAADPSVIQDVRIIGTQLFTGSSNTGVYSWDASNLAPGVYGLGISATDAGTSIENTEEDERIFTTFLSTAITIVEPEPEPQPPTLSVTGPATALTVYPGTDVTITWSASVFEGPDINTAVDVFYDQDGEFDSGDEEFILINQPDSVTSAILDTTPLDDGVYLVGVSVDDGLNEAEMLYASGTVTVDSAVTFDVTQPSNDRTVPPTTIVDVSWTTNVPVEFREFTVYAESDPTGDGVTTLGDPICLPVTDDPDGPGFESDCSLLTTTATSVEFDTTGLSGLYKITVEFQVDGESAPRIDSPLGKVRVSTSPSIFWLGELATPTSPSRGAIFQGVNFEDNAGSSFAPAGDLDDDGADDFVIAARFGKPFFSNADGIGHGEAYAVYGGSVRLDDVLSLNSLGTELIRGITFTGIRTPQGNITTDGLADIAAIPDVDNDGRSELVFGFPNVDSRGHNIDPEQDGVVDEDDLTTLEKSGQFLRGGIVIVSSTNEILGNPNSGTPVINLDLVGQDFIITCVEPEPVTTDGNEEEAFALDVLSFDPETFECIGSCAEPSGDEIADSTDVIDYGFHETLADNFFKRMVVSGAYCGSIFIANPCPYLFCDTIAVGVFDSCVLDSNTGDLFPTCGLPGGCSPFSPGLHWYPLNSQPSGNVLQHSGFYPYQYDTDPDSTDELDIQLNAPRAPFGARIIGMGKGDGFGTSLTLSNSADTGQGDIIVSAPNRTAIGILFQNEGGLQGPENGVLFEGTVFERDYVQGGEIDGLESGSGSSINSDTYNDSGVGYLFELRSLWSSDNLGRIPPRPHQYIVGEASHCGGPPGTPGLIENVDAIRIAGNTGQKIRNIVGINDFNGDGRNDFAVGSPGTQGGTVHICFRREETIEGDFVLTKIEKSASDPERLQGAFITGNPGNSISDGFGATMATGFDFNGDGSEDLVIGTPNLSVGAGAVDIIFTSGDLITPQNGVSIDDLREDRRAVRITGFEAGDLFGYNVTNGGDIDGDGLNDLVVSAPGASPHHDPNPNDTIDELTEPGLDLDNDGEADLELTNAGLVYIILGSNVLGADGFFDEDRYPDGIVDIRRLGTSDLRGAIIVGHEDGDLLGGGDAGNVADGGIQAKMDRGRSLGLRSAGDVDGDGMNDLLIGAIMADVTDPVSGTTKTNAGEAYLVYGFEP